jgi:predicted dinucleotide-binding enzyme
VPDAHVVKAFNTVFAQVYASQNPKIQGKSISVFVAGDNKEATEKVQTLITKMGFDVVNAGPLKSARNIEPLAMLNISLGYGQGLGTSMGFTLLR